jgi:tyrosine-protein phosphatase YwqE
MFFFKKKRIEPVDLGWLHADMHSHLIPGIDDGSPDIETSLELVRGFADLGYRKLITTPHVLWEIYPNTPEIIGQGLEALKQAVAREGINIEIRAAAEYFIDEHFVEELQNKSPLLPISGNMVLVEFSMIMAPMDLQEVFFEMQMQGYQPVIAHPERYAYLNRNRGFYGVLKDAGYLFQLNLLSLTGYYGPDVQELSEYLLEQDFYDFAGTDLHHVKHLALLQRLSSAPLYQRLKEYSGLKNYLL